MFRYFDPVFPHEMRRMRREMNRVMNDAMLDRVPAGFPAANMWVNEEGVVVTTELPGFDSNDIEISVLSDTLTLSGEKQPEVLPEGGKYHRQEREYGKFARSFKLPFIVDNNKVDASFKNGVLQIILPRAEADKPRKINVKPA